MNQANIEISQLDSASAAALAGAFMGGGWNKPREKYTRYLEQQETGEILCLVAHVEGQVAG